MYVASAAEPTIHFRAKNLERQGEIQGISVWVWMCVKAFSSRMQTQPSVSFPWLVNKIHTHTKTFSRKTRRSGNSKCAVSWTILYRFGHVRYSIVCVQSSAKTFTTSLFLTPDTAITQSGKIRDAKLELIRAESYRHCHFS